MKKERFELYNKALTNNVHLSIIMILKDIDEKTISQLHKEIQKIQKRKHDYKAIYKQVIILKKDNIVSIEQRIKEQGQPVYVKLRDKKEFNTYLKNKIKEWNNLLKEWNNLLIE
jgi:hypothetical protein